MGEVGAVQNVSKQENVAFLAGAGAHNLTRFLRRGECKNLAGARRHRARYLGEHLSSTFSPAPEVGKRLESLRVSYYTMGSFWFSTAPWKLK
eukprot:6356906-Pyramimonas_sp.AAC.1